MSQIRYDFINGTDADVSITITLDPLTGSSGGPHKVAVYLCDPKLDAEGDGTNGAYATSMGSKGPVFLMPVPAQMIVGFIVDGTASYDALPKGVSERVAYKKDPWPPPPSPTTGYGSPEYFLTRYYNFNRGNEALFVDDDKGPATIERRETSVVRVTYVAVPVPGYENMKRKRS